MNGSPTGNPTCLRPALVVGIGSPHGDDRAGWIVVDRLRESVDPTAATIRRLVSPIDLLDHVDGVDRLLICDACRGLGPVGHVRCWTWPARELFSSRWSGTHDLSLPAVLKLTDTLGRLPRHVVVWAIEASDGCPTDGLSPEVSSALPELVGNVARELTERKACTNSH